MSASSPAELRKQVMELSAGDRLALAAELLESVEGREDQGWASAWALELDRRASELDTGVSQSVPWEEVKSELLSRLREK